MSLMFAKMTTQRLALKPGTKNAWVEKETIEQDIDRQHYDNVIGANQFFKSHGRERMYRSYTSHGYLVTRIISKDPTGTLKTIRTFEIL